MTTAIQHPTQLWVSDPQTLNTQIILHLQKKLCRNQACQTCITCKQVAAKEHPWVIWLTPERSYTLEQIDELITMTSFRLDSDEQRFFIIPQAERLTDQCSNRLLKTIEEPFAGYNFFFLAARPQALPLTIQSRCVVQKFTTKSNFETYKDFLQPFLQLRFTEPISFIKQLDALDIKEQETKELIDDLFDHWSAIMKSSYAEATTDTTADKTFNKIAYGLVAVFQQAINNPPMTGSAKIFWKNLYIAAHHATKVTKSQN
jgi:DNA polymerase III delta prime subunit